MIFEFHFDAAEMDAIGLSAISAKEMHHRRNPYSLSGNQLVSAAINEGKPVHVALVGDSLVLTMDEVLKFSLKRQ